MTKWNEFSEPVEPKPIEPIPEELNVDITDPTNPGHWSKDEKYDAEACLEAPYKKHLGRHANKWVCKHHIQCGETKQFHYYFLVSELSYKTFKN